MPWPWPCRDTPGPSCWSVTIGTCCATPWNHCGWWTGGGTEYPDDLAAYEKWVLTGDGGDGKAGEHRGTIDGPERIGQRPATTPECRATAGAAAAPATGLGKDGAGPRTAAARTAAAAGTVGRSDPLRKRKFIPARRDWSEPRDHSNQPLQSWRTAGWSSRKRWSRPGLAICG